MLKTTAELMPISAMTGDDAKKFIDFQWEARKVNNLDIDVLRNPRTVMAKASKGTEAIAFVPVQPALLVESFAAAPTASASDRAMALVKIGEQLVKVMKDSGICETYFLAEDTLADFALNHGWEEVKGLRLLKRKLTREEKEVAWGKDKNVQN